MTIRTKEQVKKEKERERERREKEQRRNEKIPKTRRAFHAREGPEHGASGLDSSPWRGWTQASEEGAATKDILGGDSPPPPSTTAAPFFSPFFFLTWETAGPQSSLGVAGSTTPGSYGLRHSPRGLEGPYLGAHATACHATPFFSIDRTSWGLAVVPARCHLFHVRLVTRYCRALRGRGGPFFAYHYAAIN